MRDMAFPKRVFDRAVFEGLCERQCSEREICSIFKTSHNTLRKWIKEEYGDTFPNIVERFRDRGKAELRRIGYDLAKKQPAVWIFMAKNYLGMSDNPAPVDTGEQRKEFENAIKIASRALAGCDISALASIPPRNSGEEEEEHGNQEE